MVHLYACIETETTVFLILQYARYIISLAIFCTILLTNVYFLCYSCGKLWDFIRLHYEASDHLHTDIISNRVCTNEHINRNLDSNENIDESNKTEEVENNKLRKDHQYFAQNAIYMEVPNTVQLLEKSQKLLQSVNATLKKSNSIVNRLNESKELKHSKDALSTNTKARIFQEADCTLSDIYCNKSPNSIKSDDKNFAEDEDSKSTNSSSISNSENLNISENTCESVSNEHNCTIRNSLENKVNDSFYDSTSKTVNTIYVYKNNNIKDTIDRTNSSNCSTDEIQHSHSHKENTTDEEKILWQIPEAVIRSWAAEILLALEALHQQNVLILDFKPDNILLDDAGHVRLTYIIPQRNVELSKLTYPYSSPESIMYSPTNLVTSSTDVWSFGVILYELLTGIVCKIGHS